MPKLKDFLKSDDGGRLLTDSRKTLGSSLPLAMAGLTAFTEHDAADKFKAGVESMVSSKAFTDELSDVIGVPARDETEDQFVARAKSQMTNLLKKKFSK